jgi:hypothetical protein
LIITYISNIFDRQRAYIYIWFTRNYKAVYVGQTNSECGTLGRAYAHLKSHGTLRERFYDVEGISIEVVDDLYLTSFQLPKKKKYTSVESSFRLSVEYLVQVKLNEIRSVSKPNFRIISNVTYTEYCSDKEVIRISNNIVKNFLSVFNK